MQIIISQLFGARDIAHRLHLKTRSFATHLALKELYELLSETADELTEVYQGKYGILQIDNPIFTFSENSALTFISELAQWAEDTKQVLPVDSHIQNDWDTLISAIYRIKYKIEFLV